MELQTNKMTSLQIAEIAGKSHDYVLKAVRKMEDAWLKIGQSKFDESSYINTQNKEQPMYLLTKTESLYIGTKFSDEARAKLVLRWEKLEMKQQQQPRELSPRELALMVIKAEDEKERLQIEIDRLRPRSEFVDIVFNADDLLTGSQVCKVLGLPYGNITLYKNLREKGIFFKNKNEPKQDLVDRGYFRMKEILIGDIVRLQTYFTQKGLGYIAKSLNVVSVPLQPIKINA